MKRRKRNTKQQQQERLSKDQFKEFVHSLGWIVNDIDDDMGEDLIVDIWEEGEWTGISFRVQLKSVINLTHSSYRLKDGTISYPVKTKDLIHWNNVPTPIYLIVWDIAQKTGYWIRIDEAIDKLRERLPDWQKRTKVRVRIPAENITNKKSFTRLHFDLVNYFLPIVAKGKEGTFEAKFTFPPDDSGRKALESFQQHLSMGESVTIDGKFIKHFSFPDYLGKLIGKELTPKQLEIKPGPPRKRVPTKLCAVTDNGETACLPYIELWVMKSGFDGGVLANDAQQHPLHITIILQKSTQLATLHIDLRTFTTNVCRAYNVIRFFDVLSRGGALEITLLETDDILTSNFSPGRISPPHPWLLDILEKLCQISKKTKTRLLLDEGWSITPEEVEKIHTAYEAVTKGRIEYQGVQITLTLIPEDREEVKMACRTAQYFRVVTEDYEHDLLNTRLSLGERILSIQGKAKCSEIPGTQMMKIVFENAYVIAEYPRWIKRSK